MSIFWTVWISTFILGSIAGCYWLLKAVQKGEPDSDTNETTGHVYDGIEEYNNPLPKWWVGMFVGTIIFSLVYLVLYPGLGAYKGYLGWTSHNQWEKEVAKNEQKYAALYSKYAAASVEELSKNTQALETGQRLFANNCAVCHGSTASGSVGYPNLADNAWLYGGDGDTIKTSILHGRSGMMPAWGGPLGEQGVKEVANFVLGLSGQSHDAAAAEKGKTHFQQYCIACHSPDGTGNKMFGAPDLTDNAWLYGRSMEQLVKTIGSGRQGKMPAHKDLLGEEKVHVIAAYVYSLSR